MNFIIKKRGITNVLTDTEMNALIRIVNKASSKNKDEQKLIDRLKVFLSNQD